MMDAAKRLIPGAIIGIVAMMSKIRPVLLDRRVFFLDEEAHRQFVELLDAPPRKSEKLRKLLATKAPWDK